METHHLIRQIELIPMEALKERITIIGAGAIGSFTALALAKMGFDHITVYDPDEIEHENLNCQFYPMGFIGLPKVDILKDMIMSFTGTEITVYPERYERGAFSGIVISAVDNMATRKTIWENHKDCETTKLVIDPRMAIETGLIYAMNPNDAKDKASYEKTLYDDKDAVQERCTMKSVMYTPLMLAGFVSKIVKDRVTQNPYLRVGQLGIRENQIQLWSAPLNGASSAGGLDEGAAVG